MCDTMYLDRYSQVPTEAFIHACHFEEVVRVSLLVALSLVLNTVFKILYLFSIIEIFVQTLTTFGHIKFWAGPKIVWTLWKECKV